MLIMKPEEFAMSATRAKVLDYCRYCYDMGVFLEPELTIDQMAEKLANPIRVGKNVSEEDAKKMAMETLVKLKRWQKKE